MYLLINDSNLALLCHEARQDAIAWQRGYNCRLKWKEGITYEVNNKEVFEHFLGKENYEDDTNFF